MQVKTVVMALLFAVSLCACAQDAAYTDDQIKAQFVKAGRFYHAEDMDSNYDWAFMMSGNDTNRYARVLRELAIENTNQTLQVLLCLRSYKTPESLPFLCSYATNAAFGADAMLAMFGIEGLSSNSLVHAEQFLSLTNDNVVFYRQGATICAELVRLAKLNGRSDDVSSNAMEVARAFALTSNKNPYWLDKLLIGNDPSYKYSKRRLAVLRVSDLETRPFWFQINYVTNAINELVAYPEADLPD